jgi:hypothetical protein
MSGEVVLGAQPVKAHDAGDVDAVAEGQHTRQHLDVQLDGEEG